mgnify:CR=1 FL=1
MQSFVPKQVPRASPDTLLSPPGARMSQRKSFKKPFKRGDTETGSQAGRAASMAGKGWQIAMMGMLIATTIVSVTALIGMALTAHYLAENVRRLDDRIGADRDAIEAVEDNIELVEDDVAILNETMPEGNGTTFFDDEWVMANGDAPSKQFMFNASLLTTSYPAARRNYALPDEDGILALLADVPAAQTEFADDVFALFLAGDPTTRIEFDLSMITGGETRIYGLPNKDGTLATLSDVVTLGANSTTFLDSQFTIENDPDTSKSAMFDASQISGDRTYGFPNLDGTFVVTVGAQTVMDKTLEAASTLLSGPSGTAQFYAGGLTAARTYTFADNSMVLVGRNGIDWAGESMGWSADAGTFSLIRVASAFQRDRFMQFAALGTGTGGDVGRAGIELSWFNMHSYRMFTRPGGGFDLTYSQNGIPATNNALGDPILRIEPVNGIINFVDRNDGAKRARFDISGLTGVQTFAFPDGSGTLALLSDIAAGSSTFSDANFLIQNDADNLKQAQVDASGITSGNTRTYGLPDQDGPLGLNMNYYSSAARMQTASQSFSPGATPSQIIIFETTVDSFGRAFNPSGAYDNSTGLYTCPFDGYYSINAMIRYEHDGAIRGGFLTIGVDGVETRTDSVHEMELGGIVYYPMEFSPAFCGAGNTIFMSGINNPGSNGFAVLTRSFMRIQYLGPLISP